MNLTHIHRIQKTSSPSIILLKIGLIRPDISLEVLTQKHTTMVIMYVIKHKISLTKETHVDNNLQVLILKYINIFFYNK